MTALLALREALLGTVDEFLNLRRNPDFTRPLELQQQLTGMLERRLAKFGESSASLREELSKLTYVHLKSVFPVCEVPDTPTNFLPVPLCQTTAVARLTALAVAGFFSKKLVSYGSENDGELFVNLVAMHGSGAVSKNSTKSMRGHTDAVSFPFPGQTDPVHERIAPSPDVVCLLGIKNPESVSTTLMLLHELMSDLTQDEIAELRRPQFLIGCQRTFEQGTIKELGDEHAVDFANVLEAREGGQTWVRYSHTSVTVSGVHSDDPNISSDEATECTPAAAAKIRFEEACIRRARMIVVNPGDLLWVNNRQALHGRTMVDSAIGGNARWLLRTYALDPSCIRPDQYHQDSDFKLFP